MLTHWSYVFLALTHWDDISNAYSNLLREKFWCKFYCLFCYRGSSWQWVSIGSCNVLAPNKEEAITWTNVDHVLWWHMASLGCKTLRSEQNGCCLADNFLKCISWWPSSRMHITLRPPQNGWLFSGDIFKCLFLNKNVLILNAMWLKFFFLRVQSTIMKLCFRQWLGT